jgi:hypothetical protein
MTAKKDLANANIEKAILNCNLVGLQNYSRKRVLGVFGRLAAEKGGLRRINDLVRKFIGVNFRAHHLYS